MKNYYIALYDRNGEELALNLCPTWYGISEDMMKGLCIGLRHGYGGKTVEARVYILNDDGSKGKLIRVQH